VSPGRRTRARPPRPGASASRRSSSMRTSGRARPTGRRSSSAPRGIPSDCRPGSRTSATTAPRGGRCRTQTSRRSATS
jgi:hypothetical protein